MTNEQHAQILDTQLTRMALGYSARFEALAEAFYDQEGFLAPGKSMPVAMYQGEAHEQRRQGAWARWCQEQDAAFVAALRAGAAALRALQGECQWTESGDGPWEGACGAVWDFHVGGPEHNKMQFCPKCGKRLVVPPVSPVSEKE